ncbi:CDP-glycerol glycerophosphotransferase family protein [Mammaliicoccus lentus]|uniref:bifunctional glycosyltransferase/CDP-glycerol:glycerophosphate glycerophosphotransferase n=1 Tax=Mammaliicoccus lentus TaxID=42858 RepID=UPI0015F505C7|nr:bifunctional glycosyltransferase/CDP-glycerol:glycerophosphate glycerophosphotransferase [Mammaliicoccus lentus]QMU10159.1 CDP-glycerol glycerophosphotransferase family protein [Mammaliicoccus lentus]WGZ42829.1 CDP-glycerol glycerophosphotransferase family protein [Mammaliicoccus lentus]
MNKKLLSVIVPVYNVQGYLHDCIESLLAQKIDNDLYEIILINDGSKDNSGKIIDGFSRNYENIRGYHFENSGLGATRNKGIRLAEGKYIAFLDSDDFIPKKAYSSLLESAETNNADIVTSPVERFENGRYTRSGLHKKVDFTPKIGMELNNVPSLLYDTTSTNKIYKLEFLKKNNLYFPENIVYEDIYFTMTSYLKATKINIVEDVTYIWRIRTGETISISQDRFNIQSYKDRLATCFDTLKEFKKYGNREIADEFEKRIIIFDITLFFPEYKNTDIEYTKEFTKITRKYLEDLDNSLIHYCDYRKQVIYRAIKNDDNELVLNYSQDHVKTMKLELGETVKATDEYLTNDYISGINFNHSDILKTKVMNVDMHDDKLHIITKVKTTLINNFDFGCLKAFIVNGNNETALDIKNNSTSIVEIIIDVDLLTELHKSGQNKIKLVYNHNDLYTEKILSEPGTSKRKSTLVKKSENFNFRVNYTFGWDLFIEKQKIDTIFENVDIKDDKLIIYTKCIDSMSTFKLENYREQDIVGKVENNKIIFNLKDIKCDNRMFELNVKKKGLPSYNYKFEKFPEFFRYIDIDSKYEYVLRMYNNHSFSVNIKGKHSKVESIDKKGNKLIVRYSSPYSDNKEQIKSYLLLKSTNGKVTKTFESKEIKDSLFEAEIELDTKDIESFLTYGTFVFTIDYYKNTELLPESLLLNETKKVKFPFEFTHGNRKYKFISKDGHLIYLNKQQILGKTYDTKKKRESIYNYLYPLFRLLPLNKNKIVYYSYWGDQYACSPKAIYKNMLDKKPKMKNIWILNDINMPIEGNPLKVKKNSLKYWYHLATSKYFVQNTNMPVWYKKRRNQKEVQTFHGTFMKTMGFDTPEFKFETRQHKIDEFQKKVNNWNYASVPSKFMEEKAKTAFNTNVESIKSGFPRNDMMFDALKYKDKTKENLSIPSDKKVILYAPTWREGDSNIELDIRKMQETLANDYVLLVRAHYMVSNEMNIRENYPFAINVSNYPSIEELYTISDVLITDYSSVMFDFAYLKKPMIFFAYDLEKYLHGERGVYLDYQNIVPGPLVRTTEEIIESLNNYQYLGEKYKAKYEKFYNDFCQYGREGNSSLKVIDKLIKK